MNYEGVVAMLEVWSGILTCLSLPLIAIVMLLTALRAASRMSEPARAARAVINRIALRAAAWFTNQPAARYRADSPSAPPPHSSYASHASPHHRTERDCVTQSTGVFPTAQQAATDEQQTVSQRRLLLVCLTCQLTIIRSSRV